MKKIISFLLIAALVLSFVPFSAFAVEITSIEFTPANPDAFVFYQGQNTEDRVVESTGEHYLSYRTDFSAGDTLTVHFSDESSKDYVADWIDGEIYFVNGDEKLKQWDDVTRFDNQENEHWLVGGEYTFYVEYSFKQAPVTARIIPSPVDSISYTSSRPIVCYSEAGGYFDIDAEGREYYHYNAFGRYSDDILTVNYSDGRGSVDYILRYDPEMGYYSDGGDFISERDVRMFDRQYDEPFNIGDDNCIYVEYFGKTAPVPVTVVVNPISDLIYTPAEDIVIYEHTNGRWDTDWEGKEYYDYNIPWFKSGDTLTVTFTDSGKTVTYTYIQGDLNGRYYNGFYDIDDNYEPLPDSERELFVTRTGEWEFGDGNFMRARYKANESNSVRVNIIENPVKGIRYEPVKAAVYCDGDTYYDNNDNMHYYSSPSFEDGDKLIVIDKYGAEKTYTYYKNSMVFMSDDYQIIQENEVSMYHNQREKAWSLGDTNEYYVEYMGNRYTLHASIIENPIRAIEYTPAEPIVRVEGRDSYDDYYYENETSNKYTHFGYPTHEIGDKLTVHYNDDRTVEYILVDDGGEIGFVFKDEKTGDTIDPWDVTFSDDQYHNPWHVGVDNELYVKYKGVTCTIHATVLENTVREIRFQPAKEPVVYQGIDSYYNDEYGHEIFNEPGFNFGDRLTVVDKNGKETVYVAERDERGDLVFAADGKEPLYPWDDIFTTSNQGENGEFWEPDRINEYFVEYMGFRYALNCSIRQNPVASIEYVPANETVYLEGTHYYYDEWAERDVYEIPNIEEGDILRVTYNDSTVGTVDYTAEYDFETDSILFVSESGETIETRNNRYFWINGESQFMEPWSVGGDNYYTVEYFGATCDVPVTILALSYTSMEYIPANGNPQVYECYSHPATNETTGAEFREYEIPDFKEGDIIRLTDEAGKSDDYVLTFNEEDGERYFVGENYSFHQYEVFRDSNQSENQWTIGGQNYYNIELFGLTARVQVDLIDTDVAAVEYIKESPVVDECTGGELRRDFEGQLFYFYNVANAEAGDIVRVTYKDNRVVDYVIKHDYDEAEGIDVWYAKAADGDELTEDDASIFDRQYDEHWVPGGENKIYVLVHGVEANISVIINHTPAETPAIENETTASCTDDGGYDEVIYCTACGEELSRERVVTEHSYGHDFVEVPDYIYLKSAADGEHPAVYYKSCSRCGEVSDETFEYGEPTAHSGDYTGGEEPTDHTHEIIPEWRSNRLYHWHDCALCDWHFDLAAHTESDWITDEPATTTSAGHKHIECTVCGYILAEETIPQLASYTPGDINNDGKVNNKDLTRLFQYLSGWSVEVNPDAIDVNGDGKVNNKDLTRLFQYLSGWSVEIH